ncbi:MAG: hypothetical protein HQL06_05400 [Nitrospirae bacterium]|nr:hypothetical protein [Nitrospirota bacterium]
MKNGLILKIINVVSVLIAVLIILTFMTVVKSSGEQVSDKGSFYIEDGKSPVPPGPPPSPDYSRYDRRTYIYDMQPRPYTWKFTEPVPLDVYRSVNPMGNLNANMIFLADQLQRNVDMHDVNLPVIVTTFQNLDNLKETNRLGRLIAESLIHEFQVRRWTVIDIRLVTDVIMNESGEFSLSRDIKKIKDLYNIGAIVTGTYSIGDDCIVVNARLMNINTGVVQSSGQVAIPFSGIESLLQKYTQPKNMKIKGESFDNK